MAKSRGPQSTPESDTEYRMTTPDDDRSFSDDNFSDVETGVEMDNMASMPDSVTLDSGAVLDGALVAIEESLEGTEGTSVVLSLPGSVESSLTDTTCPAEPEERNITPETLEGPPSPSDILVVSPGASVPSFPMEPRIEVRDCSAFAPAVRSLIAQLDEQEKIASHQQRMFDHAAYSRFQMRQALYDLAKFAGVDVQQSNLGCQCPGKH